MVAILVLAIKCFHPNQDLNLGPTTSDTGALPLRYQGGLIINNLTLLLCDINDMKPWEFKLPLNQALPMHGVPQGPGIPPIFMSLQTDPMSIIYLFLMDF